MCTAITYQTKDSYFGRNLDIEYSYNEAVTVTPRNFPFHFRNGSSLDSHYAIIGMATISDNYPLYYDATNEKGLSIAGLNFPQNAVYFPFSKDKENIAPFELIPWLLGQCETVKQVRNKLQMLNLWDTSFSKEYPLSPLHWMIADSKESISLESMSDGIHIYENAVGVLTNNPPFDFHMYNLTNYLNLTPMPPDNRFSQKIDLTPYSLGMGAIGLPGDLSSASRFVKAAYTKLNSISGTTEVESISQFFHILSSVVQQRGLTPVRGKEYEFTLYSSCCNTNLGIYYYRTYENSQISGIDMHKENLDSSALFSYPLIKGQQIHMQN